MERLRDTSGASLAIALVFFLICAIIGSIVLTAASANEKAIRTQKEMQQAEFAVGSTAGTVGDALASSKVVVDNGAGLPGMVSPTVDEAGLSGQDFARAFWSLYGDDILAKRAAHESFSTNSMTLSRSGETTVYGRVIVASDLDIHMELSLSGDFAANSPYNMSVFIQCVPSYDAVGDLLSFSYEQPVVQVAGNGVDGS